MKSSKIKNVPHSIRNRLNNIAKKSNRRFDAVALQYFQERLLYRISKSDYRKNIILKGAFLLLVSDIEKSRPTKDIDFLGHKMSNDPEDIKILINSIISLDCDDGLVFVSESITSEIIKEGAQYEGVRIKLDVLLGTMRRKIQLDFGFGDKLLKEPVEIEFPVLLNGPSPKIMSYPLESVIAEKFEAVVKLNFYSSRIKDFYDILFLANLKSFKSVDLRKAFTITFENRGTSFTEINDVFSSEFMDDTNKHNLWNSFIKKNDLIISDTFSEIINQIRVFIEPIFDETFKSTWDPIKFRWS